MYGYAVEIVMNIFGRNETRRAMFENYFDAYDWVKYVYNLTKGTNMKILVAKIIPIKNGTTE